MNISSNDVFPLSNNQIPQETLINPELPGDVLNKIFSFLEKNSMHKTGLVNNFWREKSIDVVRNEEFNAIKDFLVFIEKEFFLKETKESLHIDTKSIILNAKSLLEIKSSVNGCIKNILNKIRTLNSEQLTKLQHVCKDNTFFSKNFLKLTEIYKDIASALQLPVGNAWKLLELDKAFQQFKRLNALDEIKELADKIAAEPLSINFSGAICEKFLENNLITEAFSFANARPQNKKFTDFEHICFFLTKIGKKDEAIKTIDTMPDHVKKSCFQGICGGLIYIKKTKEALEFVDTLPPFIKEDCLKFMFKKLLPLNEIDSTVEVGFKVRYSLQTICQHLASIGKTNEARNLAQQIVDPSIKQKVEEYIRKQERDQRHWCSK